MTDTDARPYLYHVLTDEQIAWLDGFILDRKGFLFHPCVWLHMNVRCTLTDQVAFLKDRSAQLTSVGRLVKASTPPPSTYYEATASESVHTGHGDR